MRNTYTICLLSALITLFCFFHISTEASNYVKVAVIGGIPRMNKNQEPQKLVDQVIEFWGKQLKQVLPDKPDLIVLPEACDRPSGMSREEQFNYYHIRKDQVKEYLASAAKENHCYIAFGTKRQSEDGIWYNSAYILDREGRETGVYNKNFPTIGEMESGIKAGDEVPVIQCDFGRVALAICFDLNFPELLAKYRKTKPDIVLFSSIYHGGLMQNYWAYSCRSFFVGSIGDREAPSEIRNPLGEVVASTTNYFNFVVAKINLDRRLVHLDENWDKLTRLKEKYGDGVTVKDPGQVGAVLVTSENDHVTADQMVEEFEIKLLDDYFDRSRKHRLEPGNIILSSLSERPFSADDRQSKNNQLQKEINPMKRYGKVIKVKSEKLDYYKKLHAKPWPEVVRAIRECHIRNFSIYLKDDYLFSYYEYVGNDYDADMKKLSELTREWLKETDLCQEPVETAKEGEWWAGMEEVFHAD